MLEPMPSSSTTLNTWTFQSSPCVGSGLEWWTPNRIGRNHSRFAPRNLPLIVASCRKASPGSYAAMVSASKDVSRASIARVVRALLLAAPPPPRSVHAVFDAHRPRLRRSSRRCAACSAGTRTVDQQRPQRSAAALADPEESRPSPRRTLSRHKPEPCGHLARLRASVASPTGRDQRRRGQRAGPRDPLQAPTCRRTLRHGRDPDCRTRARARPDAAARRRAPPTGLAPRPALRSRRPPNRRLTPPQAIATTQPRGSGARYDRSRRAGPLALHHGTRVVRGGDLEHAPSRVDGYSCDLLHALRLRIQRRPLSGPQRRRNEAGRTTPFLTLLGLATERENPDQRSPASVHPPGGSPVWNPVPLATCPVSKSG